MNNRGIEGVVVFLTCLLFFGFASSAMGWEDCGECCEWDPDVEDCVTIGGCPACYSCLNCNCECTSECCDDSACGPCQECNLDTCYCDDICIECEECVEDNCISCGALGKVCCEGWCEEPCEEEDDETMCSSANDEECIKCVGILGGCSSHYTHIYTNATTYSCNGGCYGDCQQIQGPACYRIHKCTEKTPPDSFAECTSMSETGPVPLDCYPVGMPWYCYYCVPWWFIEDTIYAECWRCQ